MIDPFRSELDGTWRSRGYGEILDIRDGVVHWIDTTSVASVEREATPVDDFGRSWRTVSLTGSSLSIEDFCGISRFDYDRMGPLDAPPIVAGEVHDPVLDFDVFWQTFWEQFAFFDTRGVDWQAVGREIRPRIRPETSETELRELLAATIRPLADGHTIIQAGDRKVRSDPDPPRALQTWLTRETGIGEDDDDEAFLGWAAAWLRDDLRLADLRTSAGGMLISGFLDDRRELGYLATQGMSGFGDASRSTTCTELDVARPAIADAISHLGAARTVIVDVRFNSGGFDSVALALAAHFADRRRLVCTKRARDGDGWTATQEIHLEPAGGPRYLGPATVLTSASTASAAEVFVMAMRELPNVTTVGTNTEGVTSDQLRKRLPNGWTFWLSNECYETPDGVNHERYGVPPDVEVAPTPDESMSDYLRRGVEVGVRTAAENGSR